MAANTGNRNIGRGAIIAAVCIVAVCAGVGFTAASMADTGFDPSSYLAQNMRDKASDELRASYDLTSTETDSQANRQDDESEDRGQTAQDLQIDEQANSSVYENVGNNEAQLTVAAPDSASENDGTQTNTQSTQAGTTPAGPVVNPGTIVNPTDDNGGGTPAEPSGPSTPSTPTWTDPDPDSGYKKGTSVYGDGTYVPYTETDGNSSLPTSQGTDSWRLVILDDNSNSSPDEDSYIEPIYQEEYLTEWKLLCSVDAYAVSTDETGERTVYRLTSFGDNFKVVSPTLPCTVGNELTVEFAFRASADSEWATTSHTFTVNPYKISLRGYDDENGNATYIANLYPAEGETIDLTQYYAQALPASALTDDVSSDWFGMTTYTRLSKMFMGWSEAENGESVGNSYTPTQTGRTELYPLPLVDVPEEYTLVKVEDTYGFSDPYIQLSGWNQTVAADKTTLTVPSCAQAVDFSEMSESYSVERMVIPAGIESITLSSYYGGGITVTESFDVDAGNASYCSRDGVLYYQSNGMDMFCIPTNKTSITVESDVTSVNFEGASSLSTIIFTGTDPMDVGLYNWMSLQEQSVTVMVPAESYAAYLLAWSSDITSANALYGCDITLAAADGTTPDYEIVDGSILGDGQTALVQIDSEAYDIFVVPDGITTIKSGAMDSAQAETLLVPESVTTIETGSLFGSGTLSSLHCLGSTPPAISADTFDDAPDGFRVYVTPENYNAYLQAWGAILGDETAKALLEIQSFEITEANGNSLFRSYADSTKATATEVVLLEANSTLTEFTAETIPGLTAVNTKAFTKCDSLKFVTLPASCTKIGAHAFEGTAIQMVDSLATDTMTIRPDAFANCDDMSFAVFNAAQASIQYGDMGTAIPYACWGFAPNGAEGYGYGDFTLDGLDGYTVEKLGNGSGYVAYAYSTYGAQTRYLIASTQDVTGEVDTPDNVTGIYAYAFAPYNHAYSGAISFNEDDWNRFTLIDNCAFSDGYSSTLTGMTALPESIQTIGEFAFAGYNGFESIGGGSQLETIYSYAFYNCTGLKSFDASQMGNLTSIGYCAFYGCENLETFNASGLASLTSLGDYAFTSCSSLTSFDASGMTSLTSLGEGTFNYCTSLQSVTLPASIESLWPDVFYECSSLTTLTFTGATPPQLTLYGSGYGFSFGEDLPENFCITLTGEAAGHEQDYIDAWKYYLLGLFPEDELTEEQDLEGTNLARALFGLEALESLSEGQNEDAQIGEEQDDGQDAAISSLAEEQEVASKTTNEDLEAAKAETAPAATAEAETAPAATAEDTAESDEGEADVADESPDGSTDALAAEENSERLAD